MLEQAQLLDWSPLWLTFKLAALTTLLLLPLGLPIAAWLAFSRARYKPLIETLVAMPLVLPPTVLGFYLLLLFSPAQPLGGWLARVFDLQLVFSFGGLLVGSLIFSLPFMVQPIQAALRGLPPSLLDASRTLGKSDGYSFFRILLPNIRPALLTGVVLSFAHTVGEFGVVLMIGGNIPGQTRLASMAIYAEVESLNYAAAHLYSAVLFACSFIILLALYLLNGRAEPRR